MNRPPTDVVAAIPMYPHVLHLRFADGTEGTVDFEEKPADWWQNMAAPLRDPAYFALVQIDERAGTVVWPNRLSLAPEVLYDAIAKPRRTWFRSLVAKLRKT